jgi:hypothetical protein
VCKARYSAFDRELQRFENDRHIALQPVTVNVKKCCNFGNSTQKIKMKIRSDNCPITARAIKVSVKKDAINA